MIRHAIVPISQIIQIVKDFEQQNEIRPTDRSFFGVRSFINDLRADLWCYADFPYVDKVYRDSYYFYFASKLDNFSRDCLRIGFFFI